MPARYKDFSHQTLSREVREKAPEMTLQFVSGEPVEEGFISVSALLEDTIEERMPASLLANYRPDALQPGLFQLSGGTTGVPKIIPRTHNDYSLNFKAVGDICAVTEESVVGIAIPVSHNFALSCPGLLGGLYKGAKVVLSRPRRQRPSWMRSRRKRSPSCRRLLPCSFGGWNSRSCTTMTCRLCDMS